MANTPFTLEDLKKYEGYELTIKGHTFKLEITEEMSGELATWKSGKYSIIATPFFEGISVPLQVEKDDLIVGEDVYYESITCFESYRLVVIMLSGDFIEEMV